METEEEGSADPQTASTQLKRQRPSEQTGLHKKLKASKLSIDLITLIEGDLHDIGETVHDVTTEALQNFMEENQIVLEALREQIQELQVRTPQVGTLSTSLAIGTTATEEMLRARTTKTIVLPKAALVTINEVDKHRVSTLKGIGINMVALPQETLYVLQDVIAAELQARESRALQALIEQKINMEQLSLQRNEVVSQNRQMVQILEEACQMVPELAIPADAPAEAHIHRLAAGVCKAREEMAKVQLELNL